MKDHVSNGFDNFSFVIMGINTILKYIKMCKIYKNVKQLFSNIVIFHSITVLALCETLLSKTCKKPYQPQTFEWYCII